MGRGRARCCNAGCCCCTCAYLPRRRPAWRAAALAPAHRTAPPLLPPPPRRCAQQLAGTAAQLAVFRFRDLADAQANRGALKKLFNSLSLRLHPDKNLGDPLAKGAFQHLSAAHDALRALLQLA